MKKPIIAWLCAVTVLWQLGSWAQPVTPPAPQTHPHHQDDKSPDKYDIVGWFWERSDMAFHGGDYPRAIGLHKAIVALDPQDVESYSVAAWLMWSLGNGDEAQRHIDRGLKANPDNWEMWDIAGQQHDLQKYFSKAQNAYTQAAQLIPPNEDSQMLRRRLAHAAENAGDLQTAQQTWQQLTQDFPNDAVNKNNLQRVQQKMHPSRTTSFPAHALALFSALLRDIIPAV